MFGVILTSIGTLFEEIGDLIGKAQAARGKQTALLMGFLDHFWMALVFLAIIILKSEFVFSLASLPTFIPRVILEIAQAHVVMLAIIRAERSTFGFIRVLTLPLLLLADFFLGYSVSLRQSAGIAVIILTLMMVFLGQKQDRRGRWLTVFTAVNAVATLSLYKYNITHFNSVEAEQFIVVLVLLCYFWAAGFYFDRQNHLRLLFTSPVFLAQSLAQGAAGVLDSFAYHFAPASIITAAKRSSATSWTVLSGRLFFSEKNLLFKLGILALLVTGIILLVL